MRRPLVISVQSCIPGIVIEVRDGAVYACGQDWCGAPVFFSGRTGPAGCLFGEIQPGYIRYRFLMISQTTIKLRLSFTFVRRGLKLSGAMGSSTCRLWVLFLLGGVKNAVICVLSLWDSRGVDASSAFAYAD